MRLDGVHIHIDERGIVEELGDLAVTVDLGIVPVVTVTGFTGTADIVNVCAQEPMSVLAGTRALWVTADGDVCWKTSDGAAEMARRTNDNSADADADDPAHSVDVSELETENAALKLMVSQLEIRLENQRTKNKRLETKLAARTKEPVTPID